MSGYYEYSKRTVLWQTVKCYDYAPDYLPHNIIYNETKKNEQ